jgi:hypothetical protein
VSDETEQTPMKPPKHIFFVILIITIIMFQLFSHEISGHDEPSTYHEHTWTPSWVAIRFHASPTQKIPAVVTNDAEESTPILPSHAIGGLLYEVAKSGDVGAVKTLLNGKADVNAQGGFYGNALQATSLHGNEAVARLLLANGAEVNAMRGEYGNALQAASRNGHEAVVRLLLEKGAEVNVKGGRFGNALQAASLNGDEVVVQLLLESGADVNAQVRDMVMLFRQHHTMDIKQWFDCCWKRAQW